MATAAVAPRTATRGFFQVPHSFAENQAALIPAERALALIILRRSVNEKGFTDMNGTAPPLSPETWVEWTGMQPRQLEYAIEGLRAKGLEVNGRGRKATYSWNWTRWHESIRNREQIVSPNADPKRKEREAKPGAKVAEECHDHGCAMLRSGQCPGDQAQSTAEVVDGPKHKSGLFVTKIAQYTADNTEKAWALTLAVLSSFFPLIAVKFLVRIIALARAVFPDVSDAELAEAVKMSRIPKQETEMFWVSANGRERLLRAITLIRRRGAPIDHGPKWSIDGALKKCATAVRSRGLDDVAAEVDELIGKGEQLDVESALAQIESRTLRAMVDELSEDQLAGVREKASHDLQCAGGGKNMMRDQLDALKAKFFARHAREALKLPRISLMEY